MEKVEKVHEIKPRRISTKSDISRGGHFRMHDFFKRRKLSIWGIVIVGIVALFAPYINSEINHTQTILMLLLFVLFIVLLEFIYKKKN